MISFSLWLTIIAVVVLLAMSGFFSGSETALTAASRPRMNRLAEEKNKRAALVLKLTDDLERLIGALLLGNNLVDGIKASCEVWPHETRPADFHTPLKTDKPVLILEGEFDPVTPPRYGEQVMKGLGNARLIVAKGQGHNVIGRGCIPKLVGDFVDKLDPKTLEAKCVDRLGPMPAFVNFNGASP